MAEYGGHAQPNDDAPLWQQPRALIALGTTAVVLLVAGIVVSVRGGGGDEQIATDTGAPVTTTLPAATTIPAATTTPPTTVTATTTSTTTTTSTSTTTTVPPDPAVADAGADLVASFGQEVTLAALNMSHPDQSVVWRQVGGPDVTEGVGQLLGAERTFVAPTAPATLLFEVDVTGLGADVATDDLRIDVFEDAATAVFVDGERGDDGGDGSRERPFKTFAKALVFTGEGDADIHLRAIDGFTYELDQRHSSYGGTSVYGGYDADWVYDAGRRTSVDGWSVYQSTDVTLSTLDIVPGHEMYIAVSGRVVVHNSSVVGADGVGRRSMGVVVEALDEIVFDSVHIVAGAGGNGDDGLSPDGDSATAAAGKNASKRSGGDGAGGGGDGGNGGAGRKSGADGGPSGSGGSGGGIGKNGKPGAGGVGGSGGTGGDGGQGLHDEEGFEARGASGAVGSNGASGGSGRGGGGGGGLILHDGGGGGGGGAGGAGGLGGVGGEGGWGSIGLKISGVRSVVIRSSVIEGGFGGNGGAGGDGASGPFGGDGGTGANGVSSIVDTAGSGGGGGGGGRGGFGGQGGGGAGGASIGLLTFDVDTIEVVGTVIRGGVGGDGGAGGDGGNHGVEGGTGDGRDRGGGSRAFYGLEADSGIPAAGGPSIGWWDDGSSRTLTDTTIEPGTPGQPGADGGAPGDAVSTTF
jgi:hypothetical protein